MKKILWWEIDALGGVSDNIAWMLAGLERDNKFKIEKDIINQKLYVWYFSPHPKKEEVRE